MIVSGGKLLDNIKGEAVRCQQGTNENVNDNLLNDIIL